MTASLSLAVFFQQTRDWRPSSVEAASHALIREGQDVAATLTPDPLRGDPLSPAVVALVELIRPRATVRCPRCETVPVLVTPEPVDRGPWGGVA